MVEPREIDSTSTLRGHALLTGSGCFSKRQQDRQTLRSDAVVRRQGPDVTVGSNRLFAPDILLICCAAAISWTSIAAMVRTLLR